MFCSVNWPLVLSHPLAPTVIAVASCCVLFRELAISAESSPDPPVIPVASCCVLFRELTISAESSPGPLPSSLLPAAVSCSVNWPLVLSHPLAPPVIAVASCCVLFRELAISAESSHGPSRHRCCQLLCPVNWPLVLSHPLASPVIPVVSCCVLFRELAISAESSPGPSRHHCCQLLCPVP
ncbi:hypothetical protein P7K49_027735 [Saguinus oedipus]|uniref:Secreted protein n=1 Tax=Saguinus oedipus TaxID=9490 RepID=A0ABQ9UCJ2_SAGOE|nr:hypothetical protein P7K49_027735 [Saguinus oedipus]